MLDDRIVKKPDASHTQIFGNPIGATQKALATAEEERHYTEEEWREDYALKSHLKEIERKEPPPETIMHGRNEDYWQHFFEQEGMLDAVPKSESTLWNSEVISVSQAKIDFNRNLALFFIDPNCSLGMFMAINTAWQSVRANFVGERIGEFGEMINKRIRNSRTLCWGISSKVRNGQDIPPEELTATGDYLQTTWDYIWDALAASGGLLIFNRKKGYETVLERYRSATKAISGNE